MKKKALETSIKILFLVQGIFLAAISTIHVLTYDGQEVDETRLKNTAILILGLCFLHLFVSLACICLPYEGHVQSICVAFVLWSSWTTGFVIYQTTQVYEYEKVMNPTLLSTTILTGILSSLVIVEGVLHAVQIRQHFALN